MDQRHEPNPTGSSPDPDATRGADLPPLAPSYDFRTGQPLPQPRSGEEWSDDTDLGIWDPQAGSGTRPAVEYGPPQSAYPPVQAPPPQYEQIYQPYQQPGAYQQPQGYVPPGYQPTLPHQAEPRRGSGRVILAAGAAVLLVAAVAVLAFVAFSGGGKKSPAAKTGPITSSSPNVSGGGGATAPTTGGGQRTGPSAARVAFLHDVDGILAQSSAGRAEVVNVVNGVVNGCSVPPQQASDTIRGVISNRQSVLNQARALAAPDATSAALQAQLVAALQASIEANQSYQTWLDFLYTTYFNTEPVGCPDGVAPTDSHYDAATAASERATAAKQTFVAAYNPQASAAGLRTWSDTEF